MAYMGSFGHRFVLHLVDGALLFWVDYQQEQPQFVQEVMPLLEQAGLRRPFQAN